MREFVGGGVYKCAAATLMPRTARFKETQHTPIERGAYTRGFENGPGIERSTSTMRFIFDDNHTGDDQTLLVSDTRTHATHAQHIIPYEASGEPRKNNNSKRRRGELLDMTRGPTLQATRLHMAIPPLVRIKSASDPDGGPVEKAS